MVTRARVASAVLWAVAVGAAGLAVGGGCGAEFTTEGAGGGGATTTTSHTVVQGGGGHAEGGGGQGGTGPEDCGNGADDDGDLAVDCADADCATAGFSCLDVPLGFTGPVLLADVVGAPSCPPGWSGPVRTGGGGVTGAPLGCDCACEAPVAPTCPGVATVRGYNDGSCQAQLWSSTLGENTCMSVTNAGIPVAYEVELPPPGGACAAGTPSVTSTPEPGFTTPRAVCGDGPLGGGCAQGGCVPPNAVGARVCVIAQGDVACPPGGFVRSVLYTGLSDDRSCGCTCQLGSDCTAILKVHTTVDCSGGAVNVPSGQGCSQVVVPGGTNTVTADLAIDGGNFECLPHAQAQGSVTATTPFTLCCLP